MNANKASALQTLLVLKRNVTPFKVVMFSSPEHVYVGRSESVVSSDWPFPEKSMHRFRDIRVDGKGAAPSIQEYLTSTKQVQAQVAELQSNMSILPGIESLGTRSTMGTALLFSGTALYILKSVVPYSA